MNDNTRVIPAEHLAWADAQVDLEDAYGAHSGETALPLPRGPVIARNYDRWLDENPEMGWFFDETEENLLQHYPAIYHSQILKDLQAAYEGLPLYQDGLPDVTFRVEQMSTFEHDAELIGSWGNGSEDEHESRVQRIIELIKAGEPQLPVFVNENGGRMLGSEQFVVEGFHRLVAFSRLGLTTVPVVRLTED